MTGLETNQDITIVNEKGEIIYIDANNLKYFDLPIEEIMGKNVSILYSNNKNNNAILKTLNSGESSIDIHEDLITPAGRIIHQKGSIFPIVNGNKVAGAIKLSKSTAEHRPNTAMSDEDFKHNKNGTWYTIDDIITQDKNMMRIKKNLRKIAMQESTVLIYGKTGTGKEMIAQSIHNCSKRSNNVFISQNCSAIPENLLESILFGTTKGSFTGAENKQGLFEMAQGGTIFLDEINSLNPYLQVKLLKAIEEKKVRRIGGSNEIMLDVRIIAASNEDPEILVKEKRMREDLYYRLSVVKIELPNLKDRKDDIEPLIWHYINYYNKKYGYSVNISNELIEKLKSYSWPGNIRELKNVIEGAFANITGSEIKLKDLPDRIFPRNKEEHSCEKTANNITCDIRKLIRDYEKKIILSTYIDCKKNIPATAAKLKMSQQLLRYKLKKYGEIEL